MECWNGGELEYCDHIHPRVSSFHYAHSQSPQLVCVLGFSVHHIIGFVELTQYRFPSGYTDDV